MSLKRWKNEQSSDPTPCVPGNSRVRMVKGAVVKDADTPVRLGIKTYLHYATHQPCDLLLQIEAVKDETQYCERSDLILDPCSFANILPGEDGIGTRRWVSAGPAFECTYQSVVTLHKPRIPLEDLHETPRRQIPSDVIKYLMPSRFCHSEQFLEFSAVQFPDLTGGRLVKEMSDWIYNNFTYDPLASQLGTTASDSFASLSGVCRDYAHVLIALARAAGIPARFVSGYAPDVTPQDFHAVVEVYLEGSWHCVDPTGMAQPHELARICIGRDAADASFMTSYGWMMLQEQYVEVTRLLAS